MIPISAQLYAQWRLRGHDSARLQESGGEAAPNERLLQLIWQHQRVRRAQLETVDGRPVRVLHPGFWNHEPGPDFRQAVVQIGESPAASGDVEVDLIPGGWRHHAHDINPHYRSVILHVVWDANSASATHALPTLALKPFLDAPLEELEAWLGRDAARDLPQPLRGQCSAPLRNLPAERWTELLRQAAEIRLQAKAAHLEARARDVGWDQALWEGIFGALGYKHNVWPMRRLAELLPTLALDASAKLSADGRIQSLQARLLGLSGLLPAETARLPRPASEYLRQLWDLWWRERDVHANSILPRAAWRLSGLRPANQPVRRLALAAHWLAQGDVVARIERWFAEDLGDAASVSALARTLDTGCDSFWSWHWTFNARRLPAPQPLFGATRLTDLAINVLLPWLWVRAVAGGNDALRQRAESRYFAWPAAEDNAVLRLARQRLFGSLKAPPLRTAAAQQGLLQIVRDFCQHSNALCERCQFPELVQSLSSGAT